MIYRTKVHANKLVFIINFSFFDLSLMIECCLPKGKNVKKKKHDKIENS